LGALPPVANDAPATTASIATASPVASTNLNAREFTSCSVSA